VPLVVEPLTFVGRPIGVEHSAPAVPLISIEFAFVRFVVGDEQIAVALNGRSTSNTTSIP
jgi:hypothetical protein